MTEIDRRCWRYRKGEAQMFNSPDDVPEGEGWVDSPAKVEAEPIVAASDEAEPAKKKRGRPKKDADNGDSPDAHN